MFFEFTLVILQPEGTVTIKTKLVINSQSERSSHKIEDYRSDIQLIRDTVSSTYSSSTAGLNGK